ncbi:cupin domain-containing protein [Nakamurella endophytica]|uniref:Cupin type-2 domain-containing protein n=1 Tax=Nakamurella endophytica TaxID=1748367 RepID=A0A917WCZ6_9ACTN|nr:cupin domain-containing protein [Nakamurella endophytica]GGL91255.1 hypothetical protein GCM10011594_08700 [Nakamurella endophytica]
MDTTVVQPGAADSFAMPATRAVPVAGAADTSGAWEAIELTVEPGGRSPLHTLSTDKVFYVAEGTMTYDLDGAAETVAAGGFVRVPAGVPHCYRNVSGLPVRQLVLTTGATQLQFLQGMGALAASGAPDRDRVAAHAARYGVRLL